MATYTFFMYLVRCTPRAYGSPTVQFAGHIEWFRPTTHAYCSCETGRELL